MKSRILVFCAVTVGALVASVSQAAPISSHFDGRYAGESRLIPGLSKAGCPASAEFTARIVDGNVSGKADNGGKIRGFVTSTGYLKGTYKSGPNAKTKFDGLIDGNTLVGGLTKGDTCTWVVKLSKK